MSEKMTFEQANSQLEQTVKMMENKGLTLQQSLEYYAKACELLAYCMKELENYFVRDIIRKDFNPAVEISVDMDELLKRAMNQNFIPVTDARQTFIGIVTRQDIIKYFTEMPHL